jgi:hypothetical protein
MRGSTHRIDINHIRSLYREVSIWHIVEISKPTTLLIYEKTRDTNKMMRSCAQEDRVSGAGTSARKERGIWELEKKQKI